MNNDRCKLPRVVTTYTRWVALFICAITTANCGLNTPYPSRALYTLNVDPPVPATPPHEQKDVTLRIRRIVAVAPFNGQAFVYRMSANSIRTDYYNTFAAPPADLVTSELVQWLRASKLFTAVVDSGATLHHQWVLEGRIQDLSIDMSNPAKAQAVVTMQMLLLDDSSAVPRVLFDKSYTERAPITSADPVSASAGWSITCGRVFNRIADDLSGVSLP